MLRPWWELWPERLDYEFWALEKAGVEYIRDEEAFRAGILVLKVKANVNGETVDLLARFPDLYPYFRFEVYAPGLDLRRHQNPFSKSLCLVGRATANWYISDTLAGFIQTQLPKLIRTALSKDKGPDEDTVLEEPQGEPFTDYYPYQKDAMVLVDSSWSLDSAATEGKLVIGMNQQPGLLLRGVILRVEDRSAKVLAAANPRLAAAYPYQLTGTWVRVPAPIREGEANRFVATLASTGRHFRSQLRNGVQGGWINIVAAIFPEEVRWREHADGWIIAVRYRQERKGFRPKEGAYFVRAGRAGRADLIARIPEFEQLSERRVALIGLGCVGAPSALELVRCGVGELRILDYDFVEPGTIVRWPLGLKVAGLMKAEVLRDFIAEHYPYTKVVAFTHRVGGVRENDQPSDLQVLDELLKDADLILDASAEVGIQRFMSDLARERQIPYVCISTTHGAWGGRITRIRPGRTEGCWMCLQCSLDDGTVPCPPEAQEQPVQPEGCASLTFTGANFDIVEVSLAGVRLAVATLLARAEGAYPDFDWDVGVLSLRGVDGRPIAPNWETFSLRRHPSCPACGSR